MIIDTQLQCEYCLQYFGKFVGRGVDFHEAIMKETVHLVGCREYELRLRWRAANVRMSYGDWKRQNES